MIHVTVIEKGVADRNVSQSTSGETALAAPTSTPASISPSSDHIVNGIASMSSSRAPFSQAAPLAKGPKPTSAYLGHDFPVVGGLTTEAASSSTAALNIASIPAIDQRYLGYDHIPSSAAAVDSSHPASSETATPTLASIAASGYTGYDHITWWVGNAEQTASFYVTRMGFRLAAHQGLATGSKILASYVVKSNHCTFVFKSPIHRPYPLVFGQRITHRDDLVLADVHSHYGKHGDGVKDVAFEVKDTTAVYNDAISRGAIGVLAPTIVRDDDGEVVIATIETFGDTTHTFVERSRYRGAFLPGFRSVTTEDPIAALLPAVPLEAVDHVVGNQDWGQLGPMADLYEKRLGFRRYWSPDDRELGSEYSSMHSIVVASMNDAIKMPLNEPATGLRKSQIEEFVEHYGGPGVQHIALRTDNIIECVSSLRRRGVEFIDIPSQYYRDLQSRLQEADIQLDQDIDAIERLHNLVDFDQDGYLLQLFTKPVSNRPTVFLEFIQRKNFEGFGAGNFKALFQAIEREQEQRGNL